MPSICPSLFRDNFVEVLEMLRQGSFRLPHGAGDRRGKGQQFHKVFKPTTTKQGSTLQGQSTEAIANSKAPTMSGPVGEGLDSMDSGLDDIGEVSRWKQREARWSSLV